MKKAEALIAQLIATVLFTERKQLDKYDLTIAECHEELLAHIGTLIAQNGTPEKKKAL
jgi:hypothetical protein